MVDLQLLLAPTITVLPDDCHGAVLLTGSHGGRYTGEIADGLGLRGVVFHDAGIGLERAGVAGIELLDRSGTAAATVGHDTCRIGDPVDMQLRGRISCVNIAAAALGVRPGMTCTEALDKLAGTDPAVPVHHAHEESRVVLRLDGGERALVLVDSAALVQDRVDDGAVIVTGSHGGLVGGDPVRALKAQGYAAVFNDAGIGADRAGVARLAALDRREIAAVTVGAAGARIGEAASTIGGRISALNRTAAAAGARIGEPVAPIVMSWVRGRPT